MKVLTTKQSGEWQEVLQRASRSDFYHTCWYHRLSEENGEGEARFLIYEEDGGFIALPLLIRRIKNVEGLENFGEHFYDATSVYGYAGPLCSHESPSEQLIENFQDALQTYLENEKVVTCFSRLHPLWDSRPLLHGLGECRALGQTVSIDLTLPIADQFAKFRNGHKGGIKKLKKLGIECFCDKDFQYAEDFKRIYRETMERVGAKKYYFFSDEYFDSLLRKSDGMIKLLLARFKDEIAAVGLFCLCGDIVQYHLSATAGAYFDLAPGKALVDCARVWATECGAKVFHLGGGVGSSEDSLFRFKSGFSDQRHDFYVWKWIVSPDIYEQLFSEKKKYLETQGKEVLQNDYFPAYRGV